MTSYNLIINEAQRAALLKVLANVDTENCRNGFEPDPTTGEHPLQYWPKMLEELPAAEAECPGIDHGFCL